MNESKVAQSRVVCAERQQSGFWKPNLRRARDNLKCGLEQKRMIGGKSYSVQMTVVLRTLKVRVDQNVLRSTADWMLWSVESLVLSERKPCTWCLKTGEEYDSGHESRKVYGRSSSSNVQKETLLQYLQLTRVNTSQEKSRRQWEDVWEASLDRKLVIKLLFLYDRPTYFSEGHSRLYI